MSASAEARQYLADYGSKRRDAAQTPDYIRIMRGLMTELEKFRGALDARAALECPEGISLTEYGRALLLALLIERERWAEIMLRLTVALDEERDDFMRDKLRETDGVA